MGLGVAAGVYLVADAWSERGELRIENPGPVAVLPIENAAGDADAWVRWGLSAMIAETLERTPGIQVLDPERLAAVLRERGLVPASASARQRVRELAHALGAEIVVDATYRRDQLGSRLEARIFVAQSGRTVRRVWEGEDALAVAEGLISEVGSALVPGFDPLPLRRSFAGDPFFDRLYGIGLQHLLTDPEGDTAREYYDLAVHDLPDFHRARIRRVECLLADGELETARTETQALLQIAQSEGERGLLMRLFHLLGRIDALEGHFATAEVQLREAHRLALATNDLEAQARALEELARVALSQGEPGRAEELYVEVLDLRRRLGDQIGRIDTLLRIGSLFLAEGDPAEARTVLEQARTLAVQIADPWTANRAAASLGEAHARLGDLPRAEESWRRALHFYRQRGDSARILLLANKLAQVELRQGDWKAAESLYKDQLDAAVERGDRRSEAEASVRLAWLQLRLGYPFQARDYMERALELDRHLGSRVGLQRVIAWFAYEEGDRDLAVQTLEQMQRQCEGRGCFLALDEAFLEVFRRAREEDRRLPVPGEPDGPPMP